MAVPVYVSAGNNSEVLGYALLDTQADSCFITKAVADIIQPQRKSEEIVVCTLNGKLKKRTNRYSNITLRGHLTSAKTVISAYEQEDISCNAEQIPTSEKALKIGHLSHLAHLPTDLDIPVGLLIGSDCPEALTPLSSVPGQPGQTFAIETMFGWTLCGGNNQNSFHADVVTYKTDTKKTQKYFVY